MGWSVGGEMEQEVGEGGKFAFSLIKTEQQFLGLIPRNLA